MRNRPRKPGGTQTETDTWRQKLEQIPRQLKRLRKAGLKKQSVTDPDSRFLRTRTSFELGYTADIAVSEDHLNRGAAKSRRITPIHGRWRRWWNRWNSAAEKPRRK